MGKKDKIELSVKEEKKEIVEKKVEKSELSVIIVGNDKSICSNSLKDQEFKNFNCNLVDDINDRGNTFKNLKEDWRSGCLPKEDAAWNSVWHRNVRFAALIENQASDFDADFVGLEINKVENPEWCVFPWESWW
jgi:hypothetical protein